MPRTACSLIPAYVQMLSTKMSFLGLFFFILIATSPTFAQAISPDVDPTPLVRLTGVLEIVQNPHPSVFPILKVWIDDRPRVFRVAHVEAIFPAYRAEEQLRRVSALGLRFLAEKKVLTLLQSPDMHNRPITIEGWLQPKRGILRIRSVQAVENSGG